FPRTHNSCFSSSVLAAAELITHLEFYIDLMNIIEFSKSSPALTNVENNLWSALWDPPTLVELVVVIFYYQAIGHPCVWWTENTNALDLGPLHAEVCDHLHVLINDPLLLTATDASHVTGSLDEQSWEDLAAMKAALELLPTLQHVHEILIPFLQGALTTWVRFSAEFAPGGLIDEATATKRQLAWMPSTNNANESMLGSYHVHIQNKPSMTLHQYNAEAMYRQNDTQVSIDVVFEVPDYQYIM
ncbi:hypothetical protein DFH08DRAFT_686133, partial [Mycena albidolilacea]